MYQPIFNWTDKKFPGFRKFLKNLYSKSVLDLDSNNIRQRQKQMQKIKEIINDIEIYFFELIKLEYITTDNYKSILNRIMQLDRVYVLDDKYRELGGVTIGNKIKINPNLDSREDTLMAVSHEMGHIVNRLWFSDVLEIEKSVWANPKVKEVLQKSGINDICYFREGFNMLDEALTQDTAENIVSDYTKKKRPMKIFKNREDIFNNVPYLTNFKYYGEFQEIAVKFARTMHFLNNKEKDSFEETLRKMTIKSFNSNFALEIFYDFVTNKEKIPYFVLMMSCMGVVKDASYTAIGLGKQNNSEKVKHILKTFNYLSNFYKINNNNTKTYSSKR